MRPYEVMVIFDAGAEPPAIQAVVDRLLETIRSSDGAPGHVDRWGRRPFAYEVKHRREGYYVLVEFGGEPRTVADVDRLLSLADEVLRFKVVRLPEKVVRRAASAGSPSSAHGGPSRGRGPSRGASGPGRAPGDAGRAPSGEDDAPGTASQRASSEGAQAAPTAAG